MHHSVPRRVPSGSAINDICVAGLSRPGRRVLFVSADFNLREVVSRVLGREHYEVHAVDHSGHALLLGRNSQFDVLVAELSAPDISGPALLLQLQRHCPALKAVFLANPGTPDGIDEVLVRPFTREDLLLRLELALSRVGG